MINRHQEQDPTHEPPGWTPERLKRLVELWNARVSAAKIAQALGGGLSRSAVVGKLFRLGLTRNAAERRSARALGARQTRDKQRAGEGRPGRAAAPVFPPGPPPPSRACGVVPRLTPLEALNPSHCRWPYDVAGETAFCGHQARASSAYCPAHHRRAYLAVLPPLTVEQIRARTFSPMGDIQ